MDFKGPLIFIKQSTAIFTANKTSGCAFILSRFFFEICKHKNNHNNYRQHEVKIKTGKAVVVFKPERNAGKGEGKHHLYKPVYPEWDNLHKA